MSWVYEFDADIISQIRPLVQHITRLRDWNALCKNCVPLQKLGFVSTRKPHSCSRRILVSKKLSLVLKCSYVSQAKPPKCAIPTLVLKPRWYSDADRGSHAVLLQPLANIHATKRAMAMELLHKLGYWWSDDHMGNVAMWNGQPVAIDW